MTQALAKPAPFTVRGWCPSALRPMQSGDGLIVRLHPRHHTLRATDLIAIAALAERHGNGLVDLTRRANLQLRGVTAESLTDVWSGLSELALLDEAGGADAARNVLIGPLAGIDPSELLDARGLADALEGEISRDPVLRQLPAKFAFVVDGGGLCPLDDERGDIRLRAIELGGQVMLAIGVDRMGGPDWLGLASPDTSAGAVLQTAAAFVEVRPSERARMRDLTDDGMRAIRSAVSHHLANLKDPPARREARRPLGEILVAGQTIAVGLAAPFGRLDAGALARLGQLALRLGIPDIRLSPWRSFYIPAMDSRTAAALIEGGLKAGLIADPSDPLLAIDACPGSGGCASASADTRAAARQIAPWLKQLGVRSCHISGCAKGCARSGPADLTLVAAGDCFGVVRYDTAQGEPQTFVRQASLSDLRQALQST